MADWSGSSAKMREELEAKSGLPVVCAIMPGPNVGVEFRVIDGEKPWRKAFVLEPGIATPQAFLALLRGWYIEVGKRIDAQQPSAMLRAVLAEYGEPRVREAINWEAMH
jgi:hypothetical protein